MVRIAELPGGGFKAVLDSPDQGAQGLGLDGLQMEGNAVSFGLSRLGAGFRGALDAEGGALVGQWSQGGASLPLSFTRTGPAPDPASLETVDPDQEIPAEGIPGQGLVGRWGAVLRAGDTSLRLILAVRPGAAGGLTASVTSLDQGPIRLAVDAIRLEADAVSFEIGRIGGRFQGQMSTDGTAIAGQWIQAGTPLDLVFLRLPPRP